MSKVVTSRVIAAAPQAVWEVFAGLRSHRPGLSEVENVELLTPGPFGLGTRWRETRLDRSGASVSEILEVIDIDPGRSCTIALAGASTGPQLTYVFTPVEVPVRRASGGGATTVMVVAQGGPRDGVNRLLQFFLGAFAARTVEGALREELAALAVACQAHGLVGPAAA